MDVEQSSKLGLGHPLRDTKRDEHPAKTMKVDDLSELSAFQPFVGLYFFLELKMK